MRFVRFCLVYGSLLALSVIALPSVHVAKALDGRAVGSFEAPESEPRREDTADAYSPTPKEIHRARANTRPNSQPKSSAKPIPKPAPAPKVAPSQPKLPASKVSSSASATKTSAVSQKGLCGALLPDTSVERDFTLEKRASKILKACGTGVVDDATLDLKFPTYPTANDVITDVNYQRLIKSYNARRIDLCDDDYTFGIVALPANSQASLYTPAGRAADTWDGEHVMDAQLVELFFQNVDTIIPKSQLPARWREDESPGVKKRVPDDTCDFLVEFWNDRTDAPSGKGINAITYLLQVYPGYSHFTSEITLLHGRLNRKKGLIFSMDGKNVIDLTVWAKADFDVKVNELRECLLLIQYLNDAQIQKNFKAVSVRISKRLKGMETAAGWMSKTDDYYFKKSKNPAVKDDPKEKYSSLDLATLWDDFIFRTCTNRLTKFNNFVTKAVDDVERLATAAQRNTKITVIDKARMKDRAKKLEAAAKRIGKAKVAVAKP